MNLFRTLVLGSSLFCSFLVMAHDGGHGPKLQEEVESGAILSPVIDKKESSKGSEASLVYKAKLFLRGEKATLFVLNDHGQTIGKDKLSKTAKAKIGPMKKSSRWKSEEIKLTFDPNAAEGESLKGGYVFEKLPVAKIKPYYIDVTLIEGKRELLTAFENLD